MIRNNRDLMKEKYLVYLTVNKVNGKIYVGVHKTNTPNKFDGYLGNNVWVRKSGGKLPKPETPFHRAVNKYGYDAFTRHTLFIFNTAKEAFEMEKLIVDIDFIKSSKNYNATIGGNGGGIKYTLKPVHEYDLDGSYIKSYKNSTEVLSNINSTDSNCIIWNKIVSCIKGFSPDAYNSRWSFKLKKYLPKQKSIKLKRIHQFSLNGDYLNTYISAAEAARCIAQDIEAANTIGKCARGVYSKAYGYIWSYTISVESRLNNTHIQEKETHKYTKNGKYLESFISITEAIKSLNRKASITPISLCMNGKRKSAYGFVWKKKKE